MSENRIVTPQVAELVDRYAERELDDARKFDNSTPLDESGIYSLHMLAARIYAYGFSDGERVAMTRHQGERQRARNAETAHV
ncbi:hypothetical protein [Mycolicibacter heraklionensis]|uniref:hypothetical protein n=1 Tax=Mycolicibacter heraklionensis TaxID=512402 RepID=UPI00069B44ED|nr:hypothetical protein [Mycolicibacter heraklionensis]